MELGVALPTSARYASVESILRIAEEAERLGYNSLWTYERLLYPIAGITQPDGSTWQLPESYKSTYEPIETLSYVAARTQRVKLGTSIVNAPFQSPVLLPEGKRPFLGGSPEQIAQDLTRVQKLKVDEVFFSDQASPTVDEAVRRLEEIQTAVRR